ncbi:MAG: UDP-N-acetylglucosamine 1-carboxyvinyltransferase [Saprospiraceae bacterium]|nr:UDP-N-acetylglucosamine 1-carboxyvinyltransferase [Bacteroidia bacterium]NNE13369.1 UDP-N-acetylglucosamine 1-carboxyvinyltransferase [Saprospiraceae bacterium]NNL91082.1 UDP-N-acetylglucosamine 1-carboxyvinyltransferase [Saprospiraceae bacterium]RZV56516.1 MAG: UDP-N-acetylglucosamine 1-carboxyvinyltransferase [Flavobacteriaceae bacterium]
MNNGSFIVEGNCKLSGEITPQGAKNEALQIISACLLTASPVTINNIPNIVDVRKLISLIKGLGVIVEQHTPNKYTFTAKDIDLDYFASKEYLNEAKKIRGSVLLLGPLLSRFGKAFLPKPGGDKIGRRRLDTHFQGFISLGAAFNYDESKDEFFLAAEKLKGTYLHMEEISVTGTGNVLMAACLAEGTTTIYNAACEPYIQQLSKMLNQMGANIRGIGSNLLVVDGVSSLNGTEHTILPDMIEIGSLIGLAAMTQSPLTIKNVRLDALGLIPSVFQKLGIQMSFENDDIIIPQQDLYEIQNFIDGSILTIYDAPWPGFTPDLLSIILVTAIQAKGSVLIHQKMFESRLFFVDKLIEMGAQIILCDPHRATVIGLERNSQLRGIKMSSPDIRAGVSLLIAALSAKSTSRIDNIQQIDRGYERIDERLNALGANIQRVNS